MQSPRCDRPDHAMVSTIGAMALQDSSSSKPWQTGRPVRGKTIRYHPATDTAGDGYRDHCAVERSGRWRHLPSAKRTGTMYPDVSLFIDGTWTKAASGRTIDVVNPC